MLLLRLMITVIFVTSGWRHLAGPKGRAQNIGMSPAITMFLGAAELGGPDRRPILEMLMVSIDLSEVHFE